MTKRERLECIAPYLPYGVKVHFVNTQGEAYFAQGFKDTELLLSTVGRRQRTIARPIQDCTPLLHPITSVTTIEFAGKKLLDLINDEFPDDLKLVHDLESDTAELVFAGVWSMRDVEKVRSVLLGQHIDIFNLIPKGVAKPIV